MDTGERGGESAGKARRTWIWKGVLAIGVTLLLFIQLVPVTRSNPPVTAEVHAPADVAGVLERACYDCHSNETEWPWYSRVAPASWLVAYDVAEGREHLNFSAWGEGDVEHAAEEIVEAVSDGEMPFRPYAWVHPDARLSDAERERITAWARELGRTAASGR